MMASVLVNSPVRKQQALEMPTVAAVIVDRIATGSPHSQLACCTALGVLADTPAGAAAVAAAQPTSKPAPAALASLVVAATGAAAAAAGHGGDPARPDEAVADSLGRVLAALTAIETMSRNCPAINAPVVKFNGLLASMKWLLEACTHPQVGAAPRRGGAAAARGRALWWWRGGGGRGREGS
jgi:hypothetical protein